MCIGAHIYYYKFLALLDNVFPHTLRNMSNWFCLKLTEVKRHIFIRHNSLTMVLFIWKVFFLVLLIHSLLTSSQIGEKWMGIILYMFFYWTMFFLTPSTTWSYTKIYCHLPPRTRSDFAEQHILVAFHLFFALKFNLNVAKPSKLDLLKAVAKDRILFLWEEKKISWHGIMHLSLQHLWSWVDWNSLLMLRTKSEWRIRMLDKAPRQNISPQHLQISFQFRFKALVVI